VALNLSVSNLADGNGNGGCVDLRLAISYGSDNCSLDDLGTDGNLSATVASIPFGISTTARHDEDLYCFTLRGQIPVVQVVEATGKTLIENS
jgi:hypothetical protein